jgi:lipopolysaccharide export system protein LptA
VYSGHIKTTFILFIFLFAQSNVDGQKKRMIKILNAETLEFGDALGDNVQRLKGDVQFENKGLLLYCDSAYFYPNNIIEAFAHDHANRGDSLHLYSDKLEFDGDKQEAIASGEVVLKDKEMRLSTDRMHFDMKENTSSYYTGGVTTNKDNTLTSKIGHYNSYTKLFSFKDSVKLSNPDYSMITDTLQFNTRSEIAYFKGPTTIISKESTIYTEDGWYNTQTDKSELRLNNILSTENQILNADIIIYDRGSGLSKAFNNVVISDTTNKVIITGEVCHYNQKTERSFVTNRATMIQAFEEDSLFLHADSLWIYRDTLENQNEIYAYNNAKFFKPDLQGVCDSLVYIQKDSLIRMYTEPILWSEDNQLTGEYMELKIFDGEIKQLNIDKNAFIISQVDSLHFNQIKGRTMQAIFQNNEMNRIYVNGNGQTIYFAEEEKEQIKKIIGINKLDCSSIVVYIEESKIVSMTFIQQPNGVMIPINKVDPTKLRLENFILKNDVQPLSKEDIYIISD